MKHLSILFALLVMSESSHATSAMNEHRLYVSQAMSAFYMYGLTEGDDRYLDTFSELSQQSTSSLNESDTVTKAKYLAKWQNISSQLEFKSQGGEPVFLDWHFRENYRKYLTTLYLDMGAATPVESATRKQIIWDIKIKSAFLIARALDVASSDYGATSLDDDDRKLDALEIIKQLESDIAHLLSDSAPAADAVILRRVASKIKFIKSNLETYNGNTPYTLLYASMVSLNKLLNKVKS